MKKNSSSSYLFQLLTHSLHWSTERLFFSLTEQIRDGLFSFYIIQSIDEQSDESYQSIEHIMARCSALLFFFFIALYENHAYDFRYHNYMEMTTFLQNIASQHPTKASLFKIGQTGGGT